MKKKVLFSYFQKGSREFSRIFNITATANVNMCALSYFILLKLREIIWDKLAGNKNSARN